MLRSDELVARLLGRGIERQEIVGCSEEEIARLENAVGLTLPNAYREFLRAVGHGAGDFMGYGAWRYDCLFNLTGRTKETYEPDAQFPDKAFVFYADGSIFAFFVADGTDDPPVYCWNEVREQVERAYDSFSEFIDKET